MCGICGVVGVADERLAREMADRIAHRGPDGEGVAVFEAGNGPPATLAHRRLSIIDPTERGAQPMSWQEGRLTITYNGEIYNYRELKRELEAEGTRFRSDCDTEVLLALYARHGAGVLDRINGIFAFAIWDSERGELFLARDRLGVKPLYYAEIGDRLVFGSEIKAMLPAMGTPSLRRETVLDYLTFLWVPDPDTLFEGVWKLPPGHCATYRDRKLSIRSYWDMSFEPDGRSIEAWAPELRDAVGDAVRRQMVSDVPLGSFLSGGIDSSAIVAEMAAADGRVTTYTIGFSASDQAHEPTPDDVKYARKMGSLLDVDYHEETLVPDVIDLLPRLVWHMDEPIGDPACISTYLVCRAARQKLTVVLSGMGGDEIFAGYPRVLAAQYGRALDLLPLAGRRRLGQLISDRLTLGPPGRLRGPRRNLMKFARGLGDSPLRRYLTYCSYYRSDELSRILSDDLSSAAADHDPFRYHDQYLDRVRGENWLNQLLYVDLKTFLPCLNLAYTDKMSMATSTEVRVPLLDDELVRMSGAIPPRLKLRRTDRKYVFKRSMESVLPHEIVWRPKAGFGAPVRAWLNGELAPMVGDMLSPSRVADRGLFDPAEVQRIIRANADGTEDNALRIWALLTLELWHEAFLA
ncbi:MAG TPA: asparagine synthase (glutamine-hydrolyzing) [Solirubrobacteraceae bacterium]|jgi:asparagine synthase (glutamine-hydrolysing)